MFQRTRANCSVLRGVRSSCECFSRQLLRPVLQKWMREAQPELETDIRAAFSEFDILRPDLQPFFNNPGENDPPVDYRVTSTHQICFDDPVVNKKTAVLSTEEQNISAASTDRHANGPSMDGETEIEEGEIMSEELSDSLAAPHSSGRQQVEQTKNRSDWEAAKGITGRRKEAKLREKIDDDSKKTKAFTPYTSMPRQPSRRKSDAFFERAKQQKKAKYERDKQQRSTVCFYFVIGSCQKGQNCKNKHLKFSPRSYQPFCSNLTKDLSLLNRSFSAKRSELSQPGKEETSIDLTSLCGAQNCPYSHIPKKNPCHFFFPPASSTLANGTCTRGERCVFSHQKQHFTAKLAFEKRFPRATKTSRDTVASVRAKQARGSLSEIPLKHRIQQMFSAPSDFAWD